jgi:peptidyl-tRNA hydrolase
VGIGVPHQSAIIDFVLERFTVAEQKILPEITSWAVQAIIAWFEVGIEITMSKFNGPVPIG